MTMDYINGNPFVGLTASDVIRINRFVKVSGNHTIAECDGEEQAIGISREAAGASGDVIDVQMFGIGKVEAGTTITAGNYLNSDADGKAVPESTDTKVVSAIAINGGVVGDYISVKIVDILHAG